MHVGHVVLLKMVIEDSAEADLPKLMLPSLPHWVKGLTELV